MPVSLQESKNNAQNDYDPAVIDEFRKESVILDTLTFDDVVSPAGGGATLTYGYRRLVSQASAAFRAINTEYTPGEVTTNQYAVNLAPLGGSFEVDRVLANIGPAVSGAVQNNLQQKIKATRTRFQDAVINGDSGGSGDSSNGFDGLSKALAKSSTEVNVGTTAIDWSVITSADDTPFAALDKLDDFLSYLDGAPTVLLGNRKLLARVRAAVRRSGMYVVNPVDGLVGAGGRPLNRESYGGVIFADPGDKAGSSNPIIPIETRSTKWLITEGGTAGTFRVIVSGLATASVAYNVANADLKTALEALPTVGTATVTGTPGTSAAVTFDTAVAVSLDTSGVTTGSTTVAENTGTKLVGVTDLYAYRVGLDGFHGVSTVGGQLVRTWLPDFSSSGAVKKGEVELGPVAVALKATKAAAVLRNIKV